MKICPKCRGLYFDNDIECQNCKIELIDKEIFNSALDEYYQMNQEQRINNRCNPRYETICKYQFPDDYEYDEEKSRQEILEMKERVRRKREERMTIEKEQNVPKCPTCGSTNVNKISTTKKAMGFLTVGVFSSNLGKTMECKNCGYKW